MCTVFVELDRRRTWPVLLAGIRDEFADRPWSPPAAHWPDLGAHVLGGVDLVAGGTWLAVDTDGPVVAVVLNQIPTDRDATVTASRGALPLAALRTLDLDPEPYAGFHLLRCALDSAVLLSWDGVTLDRVELTQGRHIVTSLGVDSPAHPRVGYAMPGFDAVSPPEPEPNLPSADAWGGWLEMLLGGGLPGDDERAVLVDRSFGGRRYATGSGSLVGLRADGAVRYDFTAEPRDQRGWRPVALPGGRRG
ncbi:NRDE family protein [Longispora sp. NPDC051575]|uniref:NRDE family protein n=1 Tax=Longispora sp. NPDC051575 TaxID=3154943 RepID=UPI003421DE67